MARNKEIPDRRSSRGKCFRNVSENGAGTSIEWGWNRGNRSFGRLITQSHKPYWKHSVCGKRKLAPAVGLEPTTNGLTGTPQDTVNA